MTIEIRAQKNAYYHRNKDEVNRRARLRYANSEDMRERQKLTHALRLKANPQIKRNEALRRKFGLTRKQYDAMLAKQAGCCALCFEVLEKPFVDHNHKTGVVREILCSRCNAAIGMAREDIPLLHRIIKYLEKHNTETDGTLSKSFVGS